MASVRRVLLLVESSRSYGRECVSGIASYIRGRWRVQHLEQPLGEELPELAKRQRCDGAIVDIEHQQMADQVAKLHVPVVDIRGAYPPSLGATVATDDKACARLGADHFLHLGFRNFAFCGFPDVSFCEQRCSGYVEYLAGLGHETAVFEQGAGNHKSNDAFVREAVGELAERQIARWLKSLPLPVAVLACNDARGRQVLDACASAGLAVPDEVAVLGIGNDEVICDLAWPPMSSIQPDAFRIGYEGAAVLDAIMDGEPAPLQPILLPPSGLVVRPSTDVTVLDDEEVVAALRWIREHASEGVSIGSMLQELSLSRATLDRRFRRALGRTAKEELARVRLARAKQLLVDTRYKLQQIAAMTGYPSAAQFILAFKRQTGITPGQYRRRQKPFSRPLQ
jgi:LacI family transcriptional regulator